jgi:hypothetical protein
MPVKSHFIEAVRNGMYSLLLFFLFWEWLRPLFLLSSHTELYIMEPFLIAIAVFLVVDSIKMPLGWNFFLKLIIILQTLSFFFKLGLPLRAQGWNDLLITWGADLRSIAQGQWLAISPETRTFMFLVGWAILTYAVRTFIVERHQILWFVGITFMYLVVMELWGEAPIGFAYIRVVFIGLLLQALLSLPRLEKLYGVTSQAKSWNWKWFILSVCIVSMLVGASTYLSLKTSDEAQAASWDHVLDQIMKDFSLEMASLSFTAAERTGVSGYGKDDRALGGSVELSNEVIFAAKTDQLTYWRGESKSVYTGKGWESSVEADSRLLRTSQVDQLGDSLYSDKIKMLTIDQEVLFHKTSPDSLVFTGGELEAIHGTIDESSKLNLTPDIRYQQEGEKWQVYEGSSLSYYKISVSVPDQEALDIQLSNLKDNTVSLENKEMYTQLPAALPERVSLLARRITEHANNDWEKAEAVQAYLKKHYTYETSGIGFPKKQEDFVDHFLFESQQGYCDHFSSALVVLLRAADVPARWVKGFAPGEAVYQTDSTGYQVTVRAEHAHSWAEVYVEGIGWLTVEATPGFGDGSDNEPAALVQAETGGLGDANPSDPLADSIRLKGDTLSTIAVNLVKQGYSHLNNSKLVKQSRVWLSDHGMQLLQWERLLPLLLLLTLLIFIRPLYRRGRKLVDRYVRSPRDRLLLRFEKTWMQVFREYGPMKAEQTIREYVQVIVQKHAKKEMAFMEFIRMYENVRYGMFRHAPYSEQEITEFSKKLARST